LERTQIFARRPRLESQITKQQKNANANGDDDQWKKKKLRNEQGSRLTFFSEFLLWVVHNSECVPVLQTTFEISRYMLRNQEAAALTVVRTPA